MVPAGRSRSAALLVSSGTGDAVSSSPCDLAVSIVPAACGGRSMPPAWRKLTGTPVRLLITMWGVKCSTLQR
jgi:hypothetical protein